MDYILTHSFDVTGAHYFSFSSFNLLLSCKVYLAFSMQFIFICTLVI